MSSSSSPALVLELPVSRLALISSLVMLSLTLLLAVLMSVGLLLKSVPLLLGLLLVVLVASGLALWQAGYWQPARRLQKMTWQQQGDWLLQFADGEVLSARLAAESWVTPWLWCLRFNVASRSVPPVMVWRGQLPLQTWQLWRTRLYLQGNTQASVPGLQLG